MNSSFHQIIFDKVKTKEVEIVSFDFFDTLMSRKVPHPKDIFWILAQKIIANQLFAFDISAERFQALRMQAEERARQFGPTREVTIREIYEQFPKHLFRIPADDIIRMEIDTEKEFLVPILEMKEAMQLAHHRGKKIIIVSDIYLDKEHLEEFWNHHTPSIPIRYFVSSKYKTGKYEKLFDAVIKEIKVKPAAILHIGDNYVSDVRTPSLKGITTCFAPHGSSNFWNLYNLETSSTARSSDRADKKHGDLALTTARCKVMLKLPASEIDKTSFRQYGAQVLGPVFAPFIHWIKAVTVEEDIDVVMPLMREGYMINRLLSSYQEVRSAPAFFSRRVLFQAGLVHVDRDMLLSLRFGNLESTVNDYLELVGLNIGDIPNFRHKAHFNISNDELFSQVLNEILNSITLCSKIRSSAMNIRQGVIRHFKKLATVDGKLVKKVALVDVGWNGTIQNLLTRLLTEENITVDITGLYMMTTPSVNDLLFNGVMAKGFFIDGGFPHSDYSSLSRTLEIFEQSCSPAHGSVLRHDIRSGDPILKPDLIPATQRADIDDIQDGIVYFHDTYKQYVEPQTSSMDLIEISKFIRPILRRAMLAPTQNEALLFSNWMHDDNLASGSVMPIMGTDESQAFAQYKTIRQHMDTPMHSLYWPAGALAINDPSRTRMLAMCAMYQISPNEFDIDMGLSGEMAVDNFRNGQYEQTFNIKEHQHLYRNAAGHSYIKFQVPVEEGSVLRWMPMGKPFDLSVAFIVFSYKSASGVNTSQRVDGDYALLAKAIPYGMENYTNSGWRGPGEGSAFYFRDLRSFGVTGNGILTVEVACKLMVTEGPARNKTIGKDFSFSKNSTYKNGHSLIEVFNNAPLPDPAVLISKTGDISLSGWMFDPDLKKPNGEFYIRIVNIIGETQFIPMTSVRRVDLAREMKKESEFGSNVDFGFSLKNYKLPSGAYIISVLRKDQDTFLVGKDTWNLSVEIA